MYFGPFSLENCLKLRKRCVLESCVFMALLLHGTSETRLGISPHQSISHKESKLVCAYNNVGCSDQKISAGNGNQLEERKIPSQLISELSYQRGMTTLIAYYLGVEWCGGVQCLLTLCASVPMCCIYLTRLGHVNLITFVPLQADQPKSRYSQSSWAGRDHLK